MGKEDKREQLGRREAQATVCKGWWAGGSVWSQEAGLAHCCLWLLDSRQGPESLYLNVISLD